MLHTIVEEGLDDEQYIAGYTEGFEELKESSATSRRRRWQTVCGIAAETLREVARLYARVRAPRSSSGAWASRSTSTAPTTPAA